VAAKSFGKEVKMVKVFSNQSVVLARLGVGVLSLAPMVVSAFNPKLPESTSITGPGGFYQVFCEIANWFFALVLVAAVITFLIGAFKFFTAGGNEAQVGQARQLILWALVGVAVALLSKSLIFVVAGLLDVNTGSFFGIACGGAN
jgi:hypothetical protein